MKNEKARATTRINALGARLSAFHFELLISHFSFLIWLWPWAAPCVPCNPWSAFKESPGIPWPSKIYRSGRNGVFRAGNETAVETVPYGIVADSLEVNPGLPALSGKVAADFLESRMQERVSCVALREALGERHTGPNPKSKIENPKLP